MSNRTELGAQLPYYGGGSLQSYLKRISSHVQLQRQARLPSACLAEQHCYGGHARVLGLGCWAAVLGYKGLYKLQ